MVYICTYKSNIATEYYNITVLVIMCSINRTDSHVIMSHYNRNKFNI